MLMIKPEQPQINSLVPTIYDFTLVKFIIQFFKSVINHLLKVSHASLHSLSQIQTTAEDFLVTFFSKALPPPA